jgi:hypothetical protein
MCSILAAKDLARGISMCPTPEAFRSYAEFIPIPFIFDFYDEDAIERIMSFQNAASFRLHQIWRHEAAQLEEASKELRAQIWEQRMVRLQERAVQKGWAQQQVQIAYERAIVDDENEEKQNSETRRIHGKARWKELRRPYSMFMILDDLSSDKSTMKSELLKKLINNGRHYMIMLCVAVQYSMDFNPACRGGLDWVCIFFDSLEPNVKRLFEHYTGVFPDIHSFKAALSEASRQGCCLMIKKNVPSTNPTDCVFFYKPKPTHLSNKYFGDEAFDYVGRMFYDEAKFYAAIGSVRNTNEHSKKASSGSKRGAGGAKRKTKAAAAKAAAETAEEESQDAAPVTTTRKKSAKKKAPEEFRMDPRAAGIDSWEDDTGEDDRLRVKRERDARIKQGVASLRQRLARASEEARARAPQDS